MNRVSLPLPISDEYDFVLELQGVEEVYPIRDTYNFSIPRVTARCWCDCPGSRDYCNSGTHDCVEPCVSYFLPHQTTEGCSLKVGSSQMCCSVELAPALIRHDNQFTAVRLGQPALIATISAKMIRRSTGQIKSSTVRRVDLAKAHVMEDNFKIVLHLARLTKPLLRQGWYFGPATGLDSNLLYTGSQLNALDEWDVAKLGWYKHNGEDYHFHRAYLREQISGSTLNCGAQKMSFKLNALYTNSFPGDARELMEELEHTAQDYDRKEKSVSVRRLQFPRVEATVNLIRDQEVFMSTEVSRFERFEAEIRQNDGEVYLQITFYGGIGSIEGRYYRHYYDRRNSSNKAEIFFVYLAEPRKEVTKEVPLSQFCVGTRGQVCLNPYQDHHYTCQTVVCYSDTDTPVYVPDLQAIRLFLPVDLPKWTEYMNPGEWMNGIDSPMEFGVMCAVLMGCLLVVVGMLKLLIRFRRRR